MVSVLVVAIEELDFPWFRSSTIEWFLNLTYDVTTKNKSRKCFMQASKHTHDGCNEVTLVWGSLRLAPVNMDMTKT